MTTTPSRSLAVSDLSPPPWLQTVAVWIAGVVGAVMITRSSAKKKLDAAIAAATESLRAANESLMESQSRELQQLRREVSTLRIDIQAVSHLNQRMGAVIAEKDMQIGELTRDIRARDAQILKLQAERH